MAESAPAAPAANGTNHPNTGGRGGRGRGGQRGGAARGGTTNNFNGAPNERGADRAGPESRGNRGRGRGRGRGGRDGRGDAHHNNRDRACSNSQQDSSAVQSPPQPSGPGVFGARLTKDAAEQTQGDGAGAEVEGGDDVEAEVCFICASPVSHNSVAPCNHRTCHICALRLRALYKTKACAHCRTEAADVIFTDDAEKRYGDFKEADYFKVDKNLGISYEKPEIFEDTVLLLRYNCPDEDCDVACLGWPDLHRHVRSVHQKVMCDLCTRNKKVFTHEHELFTHAELKRHDKFGDDNPGAVDQSGFKGHPECGFCRRRFYGDDELFSHCRERHERCHLCDRRNGGNSPQYFQNYDALEKHFNKDHFPCPDRECQEKKFVVFDSEMDLKAHQIEQHPNGLTKDARRVDLSSFDYRPQYQEPTRGRGGRRGGRGRDPNAEPLPAASAGNLSRAELAHQREREIHSAQSVTARSFGGQLTGRTPAQAATQPGPAPAQQAPAPAAPPLPQPAAALTPQDQARQLRHAAVNERASNLARNEKAKMDEFRERVSAYTRGGISAGDLIDAFFAIFDTSSNELGKLVNELSDIFEVPGRREGLLKAWADWKAVNEDYPSLPGPAGANTTAAGVLGKGVGASRVLKLKSSTAKSSKSAVSRQASWASAGSSSAASSSNPFPSLPPRNGGPSVAGRGNAAPAPTPSWLAARPAAGSSGPSPALTPSSSARASPAIGPRQGSANVKRSELFPALPAAKKPTSTVFTPGYTGRGIIRNNSGTPTISAWGGGNGAATPAAETPAQVDENVARKGKKGKQIMFKWG
ncbi:E3 ubiquitin-protein ligase hel2 [Cercospora zeina]